MFSRIRPGFARSLSSFAAQRETLLREIYAPFANLEKGSPEYENLALSGKVWEDYFQPADSERYGYLKIQQLYTPILREIDTLKESMRSLRSAIGQDLIAEYAHQSVQIEDNKLELRESIKINDYLASALFKKVDLASTSASEISQTSLPDVHYLLPHADASQVAELRNHIVASHWVTDAALQNLGTPGLNEDDVRCLSALVNKGTNSEWIYTHGWGKRIVLGDYRQTPISVRSNPLCIFPYHPEVPALMRRFFQWRDKATYKKDLHPLILACQATIYFLHIHPFPDGNGRVSRLMMQDYMVRQGYVPVVIQGLERQDYIRMVQDAQRGEPREFVTKILTTQLEEMHTFRMRELAQEIPAVGRKR
ncbi:fic doc family [Diplogelasinospora grovesii]|uniref:Fic doc family n=1 Tax=Diplogelasinospora grovesii TaxID=303347 RepID=A0AAN6N0K9_9PEZI|nr:fic doc family [Diplogelasinospora grovesii]